MAGKRGSYNRRQTEDGKNHVEDRVYDTESHERWTARKVKLACHRFLLDREASARPIASSFGDGGARWVSRGTQPPVARDITNPLARTARLCRRIRESFDAEERERLEQEFRRIESEHFKADTITGFALPGEIAPRSKRLARLFPNPSAHYSLKELLRNADITLGAFQEWRREAGSAIVSKTIEGRTLFMLASSTSPSTSAARSRRECSSLAE
jgi:hypothetical protein